MQDMKDTVKAVVSRVTKIPVSELGDEKLIRQELGVDSMQAIEILAILERELNIVVDPDRAFDVATMADLFRLVEDSCLQAAAK